MILSAAKVGNCQRVHSCKRLILVCKRLKQALYRLFAEDTDNLYYLWCKIFPDMIPESLTRYIETRILPRYESFDKAHNLPHVQTVIEESLSLAKDHDANPSMAYTIAAYHDTGLCRDRATHHLLSGEILMADGNLRQWFSEEQLLVMKEAVEDHRASTDHEPRSIYGRIVAEADRIIDTEITLRRTVQYGLKHYPEADIDWHYQRFHKHLMEKYAPGGYLKLWFPESKNAKQLKELQAIIADQTQLKHTFDALFKEETTERKNQ